VAMIGSSSQHREYPLVMANALLYVAELCASLQHHVIPLLPLFMPAVIQVTADPSLLARFLFIANLCSKKMY